MTESNPMTDMAMAIRALALELPATIHNDVASRWRNVVEHVDDLEEKLEHAEQYRHWYLDTMGWPACG